MKTRDPQARRRTSPRSSGSPSSRRSSAATSCTTSACASRGRASRSSSRPRSPPPRPSRPGQGQTVRVSGVRVGDITKVELEGRPRRRDAGPRPRVQGPRPHRRHRAAAAQDRAQGHVHRARPGHRARRRWPRRAGRCRSPTRCPTSTPTRSSPRWTPTRATTSRCSSTAPGAGLKGRGNDLREVFRRFEPTHRDLARVNGAGRRSATATCSRLVHSLGDLNDELAGKSDDLAALVDSSSAVFRAFASEQAQHHARRAATCPARCARRPTRSAACRRSPRRCARPPCTCSPPLKALNRANGAVQPFAKEAAPIVRDQIRPVRARRAAGRALDHQARRHELAAATPDLTSSFTVLNHLFNLVGYNPNGREDPGKDGREEGYLFWIAWLQHNGAALFSTSDANGPFRPVTLGGTCGVLKSIAEREPAAEPDAAARAHRRPRSAGPTDDAEASPLARPDRSRWCSSRCRASACCSSCGSASAARSRSSPRATSSRSPSRRPRSSAWRPTCGSPACSVGKVRDKTLDPAHPNRTVATIELDRKYAPIAKDARAILRQKTLLGETYVELTPGNKRAAGTVPDGGFLGRRPRGQDGRARRDLPGARPQDARELPDLAAGPLQGRRRPRARPQRRAGQPARLRRRRQRPADRARRPGRSRSAGSCAAPARSSAR